MNPVPFHISPRAESHLLWPRPAPAAWSVTIHIAGWPDSATVGWGPNSLSREGCYHICQAVGKLAGRGCCQKCSHGKALGHGVWVRVRKREDRKGYLLSPSKDGTVLRDEDGVVMGIVRAHIYQIVWPLTQSQWGISARISFRSSIWCHFALWAPIEGVTFF